MVMVSVGLMGIGGHCVTQWEFKYGGKFPMISRLDVI